MGTSKDTVLAMHVTNNVIREFDKQNAARDGGHVAIDINGGDAEEIKEEEKTGAISKEFYVAIIDESEYINVFSHKSAASTGGKGGF